MKSIHILSFFILTVCLLFACNQPELDKLNSENSELQTLAAQKDSSINDMLETFNQIQANLAEIKSREGIIKIASADQPAENIQDEILGDIEAINSLMKQNEALIQQLNSRLSNSGVRIAELHKMIDNLNAQIGSKNEEISALSEELREKKILIGQLFYKTDSLAYMNKVKDEEMEQTIDEMNVGYYAYGTFKELKEQNVVSKEGGFLGLGKNRELKDDFNEDYFSKIDIREQKSFLIYAKKAELITKHPLNSYEFMGEEKVDSLVIRNPEEFWKASKYLVIQITN